MEHSAISSDPMDQLICSGRHAVCQTPYNTLHFVLLNNCNNNWAVLLNNWNKNANNKGISAMDVQLLQGSNH